MMLKLFIVGGLLVMSFQAFAAEPQGLYAYETAAGMKVGAVFGALPEVKSDDELISATTPVCNHVEIHQMKEDDGIMQMRKISSVAVSAGKENALSPTGNHLMLMGLTAPLQNGKKLPLTLVFKNAGDVTVYVPVLSRKVSE